MLNFTASAAPRKTGLARQARHLLTVGLWGASPTVQARPAIGDLVVVYAGAPEQVFVGDAEVGEGLHPWTPAEVERFPSDLAFDRGLSLVNTHVWPLSVSLSDIWSTTSRAKANRSAMFRGGIVPLPDPDAELIIARGCRYIRPRPT